MQMQEFRIPFKDLTEGTPACSARRKLEQVEQLAEQISKQQRGDAVKDVQSDEHEYNHDY